MPDTHSQCCALGAGAVTMPFRDRLQQMTPARLRRPKLMEPPGIQKRLQERLQDIISKPKAYPTITIPKPATPTGRLRKADERKRRVEPPEKYA